MQRRALVASSLLLANLPAIAAAQLPSRVFRVGWIVGTSATASAPLLNALRRGLADLGYVEGRNLVINARYADDVLDRVPALSQELLRSPVDVVVTQGAATWSVVKVATAIPVVYVFSADTVEAGFAPSLARPSGNPTGLTLMLVELNGKRFELLHEILPTLRRTAIIGNPDHPGEHLERADSESSARRYHVDRIPHVAIAVAAVASLWPVLGLVYAKFFVAEPPPNVVITFSDKGLTRIFAELVSLGIGFLGLALALVVAFDQAVRSRLRALAVVSNVAVCAVCVALREIRMADIEVGVRS
jgi:hypothetical protein